MSDHRPAGALRALIVEDSPRDAELLVRELRKAGYEVVWERVQSEAPMRAALDAREWDVVISDYHLPTFDPLRGLALVRESGRDLPFILVSGTIGEEVAVSAMRAGVADYLLKDNLSRLAAAVEREVRESRMRAEARDREGKLQTQLAQAQRLESIGELAGGVAHDFNNLLAVIINYAGFVARQVGDRADVGRDVAEILTAAQRAAALTRQLLTFSRREVVRPEIIDVSSVVRAVEELLARTLGEHIEVRAHLDAAPAMVLCDRGHCEQIVMNLAVNARDAMPDGGTLTIETTKVQVDEDFARLHPGIAAGPHVRLTVTDTGVGMTAEVAGRAFEPFFTTKPRGEGTGLGLSTVYGIVTGAGGHVSIYSEPGVGTTVKILLPAAAGSATARPAPAVAPVGAARGETILVVEDDPRVRELVRRILTAHGYAVLSASTPDEALALAGTDVAIHLLLTDLVLPQRSGRLLAAEVVAQRPGLAVLYMSGYPQDALGSRGALDTGAPLLEKPFTEDGLLRAVRGLLDG